jgi:hypothetical protein
MSYEAVIYSKDGKPKSDMRALMDRAWKLNGFEQCTFSISTLAEVDRLEDFNFGNYLVVTDSELDIWGGFFDPEQPWSSSKKATIQTYSGEKIFDWRCYPGSLLLKGTAGAIYKQMIENLNTVIPWGTLMRPGDIYTGGVSREETISGTRLYDDVRRVCSRSGNDFYVEPVFTNGLLHFEGHWYAQRGMRKDFLLEEGINIEAKEDVMEYQGEIWNVIFAYGNASTWTERKTAQVFDEESIGKYGARMYALAVDSNDPATVKAYGEAFLALYKNPRRSFSLVAMPNGAREDEVRKVYKTLRIGDIVDIGLYSVYENGKRGVETAVRIAGLTHRGKRDTLEITAVEVVS